MPREDPRPRRARDREGPRQLPGRGSRSTRDAAPRGTRSEAKEVQRPATRYEPVHLSDEIVRELSATARPGKAEILVKVFADAVAAFNAEDYEEAVRLGEQAKHIALRSITAREFLGLAYYRLGRWSEATRELAAFRRLSGSTEQNPVLADCYRAIGKPERAIELCDETDARRVDPAVYYESEIVAAGALADLRRVDEAIARLERLELDPENAQEHHLRAWYVLGDLLQRRGRFTQAREWFEAIAAVDPELTDAPERGHALRRRAR